MSRKLIDRDRLKKEIHEKDIMGGLNYAWYIDHAELVDAVEVKHGKWIEADDLEGAIKGRVVCSNCKNPFESIVMTNEKIILTNQKTKYCPNCGAKMDGERRE